MKNTIPAPAWLDTQEYPFPPRYFQHNDAKQHYIDVGSGEVLLFVHGTPSWSFDFRNVIKKFSLTHRCIAIDHVGFGLSDKPQEYDYGTRAHAKRLSALINFLQLKNITLVMHDFGGPIGFHHAIQYPDSIQRMIILNSWLWNSEQDRDYIKLKRILKSPLLPFLYLHFNFSARWVMPASFGVKKLSSHKLQQFTKPFGNRKERYGTLAFAHSLLNDQAWFESLWTKVSVLKNKPCLFIWGMKDPVLKPSYLEKFISGFENTTVVELLSCGHFPQEEEPEQVQAAIQNFLKEM